MINIRKTKAVTIIRALSFVFDISLLFVAVTATQEQQQSSSLRQHQKQQRDLQAVNGRPTLIEPSQCIPRENISAIHRNPNDNRLPVNAGSVETECYTRNNSCGSSDGTAPSACCRIAFANSGGNRDAGWLVCDALNGFEWMPCVCNDNTFGSPTPEPTMEPTSVPTLFPSVSPTGQPTQAPTKSPTFAPTSVPTLFPTAAPTFSPTQSPTAGPTQPPSRSPTNLPTPESTPEPTIFDDTGVDVATESPTQNGLLASSNPTTGGTTESTTWSPTVTQTTFSPTVTQTQMKPTNPPTRYPTNSPINPTETPTSIEDRSITILLPTTSKPTTAIPTTAAPIAKVSTTATPNTEVSAPPPPSSDYQTDYRFDDKFSATILQSQCNESPPVIEFVQGSTFIYRYDVVTLVDETGNIIDTNDLEPLSLDGTNDNTNDNDNDEEDISNTYWTNEIHNELANEFMVCDYEQDTVWIIQSKTHVVDDSMPCTQGISSFFEGNNGDAAPQPKQGIAETGTETGGDEAGENIDANSNDNSNQNTCVVMKAEARILAYASPIKRKKNKQLVSWADDYASGPIADSFAQAAINYINERMNAGDFDRVGLIASFDSGEVFADENNANDNAVDTVDIDTDNDTTNNDVEDGTDGSNGEVGTETSINNDGDADGNGNSNTDTNTVGEETDTSDTSLSLIDENGNSDGNTAVGIEDSYNSNSNYNEKEGLTAPILATVIVASAFIVLLLLMGVSRRRRNQNRKKEKEEYLREVAGATDTHQDDNSLEYVMAVNHHLDLSDSDSRGDINEPGPIFQSQLKLDLEQNNIDNKVVRSPSSRQRSNICPLSSLDELDSYASTTKSAQRKGSHRGSGIQNKDPRSYQLRDTVNL